MNFPNYKHPNTAVPIGFNVETVEYKNISFNVWFVLLPKPLVTFVSFISIWLSTQLVSNIIFFAMATTYLRSGMLEVRTECVCLN
jgi:hypothetical protein